MDPVIGTNQSARFPLTLLALLIPILLFTCFTTPEGELNWLLEVGPGLIGIAALLLYCHRGAN